MSIYRYGEQLAYRYRGNAGLFFSRLNPFVASEHEVLTYNAEENAVEWVSPAGWQQRPEAATTVVQLESGRQIVTRSDAKSIYGVAAGEDCLCRRYLPGQAAAKRVLVPRVTQLDISGTETTDCEADSRAGYAAAQRIEAGSLLLGDVFTATSVFRSACFAALMDSCNASIALKVAVPPRCRLLVNFVCFSAVAARGVQLLASTLGIRSYIVTRSSGEQCILAFNPADLLAWDRGFMQHSDRIAILDAAATDEDYHKFMFFVVDHVPAPFELMEGILAEVPDAAKTMAWTANAAGLPSQILMPTHSIVANVAKKCGFIERTDAKLLLQTIEAKTDSEVAATAAYKQWRALVNNTAITWDRVTQCNPTAVLAPGRELRVVSGETFVNADGVVLCCGGSTCDRD